MNNKLSFMPALGTGDELLLWLLAAALGLALALMGWAIGRALISVPEEDRTYLDPPPLGFKLMWWLIQPLAYAVAPLQRNKRKLHVTRQLQQAGLEFQISAAQFLASQLVSAALIATVFCLIASAYRFSLFWPLVIGIVFGFFYPAIWLRDHVLLRRRALLRDFPFFLDIITLCVEAGLNMSGALQQAVAKGPRGMMQDELRRIVRDVRAGRSRTEALQDFARRVADNGITGWTQAVIQAESVGMNLGPVLRAQADQKRSERFLRAEKLAMEAPVKMLLPLVACFFPCTFVVIAFPIAMKLMELGF
jgi:tight adherence protein C